MTLHRTTVFKLYFAAFIALALSLFFVAYPQKAFAIGDSPVVSTTAPISGSSQVYPNGNNLQPYFAVGIGAFSGEYSYAKVFVPAGTVNAQVTISEDCSLDLSGTSPTVTYRAYPLGLAEDSMKLNIPPGGISSHTSRNCSGTNTFTLDLVGGGKSDVTGHGNYIPYYVEAHLDNPTAQGDVERSFRITGTGGGIVSYSRALYNWPAQFNTFGIYQRNISGLSPPEWNFALQFAPRCNESPSTGGNGIVIYDSDATGSINQQYQPQSISAALYRQNRYSGTGWQGNPQTWTAADVEGNGGDASGSNSRSSLGFNYDVQEKYKFQINGVDWRNTIQLAIPFDQLDASSVISNECGPQQCGTPGQPACPKKDAACVSNNGPLSATPGQAVQAHLVLRNTGTTTWTGFNLHKNGSSPGGVTGAVNIPTNGNISPGGGANFYTDIKAANPGSYDVNYQMRDSGGGPFGPVCTIKLNVNTTPARPSCFIHTSSIPPPAPNLTGATIPYGGSITLYPQIGNSTGKDWGSNHYVDEVNAGGASLRTLWPTGTVNATNDPNNAPYSAQHPVSYNNLTATTTFYYEVWIHSGGVNGPVPFPNPPANFLGNRLLCQFTVYVNPDNPVGNWIPGNPNCRDMAGQAWWSSGRHANIHLRITLTAGGQNYVKEWDHNPDQMLYDRWPAGFNWRPFVDWPGPGLPAHLDKYTVYVEGRNTADEWVSVAGPASFGNCLSASCSVGAGVSSPEPGEPISGGGMQITYTNNTGYPLYGYGFHVDWSGGISVSPGTHDYSGVVNPPTTTMGPGSTVITANSEGTITGVATYNGAQQPGITSCQSVIKPASRPYLKVFGGDVSAGGWFNTTTTPCSADPNRQDNPKGGIRTFASGNVAGHTYRAGSSSEFAAYALGAIENSNANKYGFYTRSLQPLAAPPVTTMDPLDFANPTPTTDGFLGFSTGSKDTANDSCIKDYYSNVTGTAPNMSGDVNAKPNVGPDNGKIFNHGQQSFSIGGPSWTLARGERITIYTEGDVYINTNINYANSVLDPSYFTLIVKGNIYIGSGVTKLEGLYIAQPTTGTNDGNIWTCSVASGGILRPPSSTETSANCKEKLVINGAVVAKHVTFNRVGGKGDLRNNSLYWTTSSDKETSSIDGSNKAVEEINYIPEMVMGSPYLNAIDNSSRLDAITVLPPLF